MPSDNHPALARIVQHEYLRRFLIRAAEQGILVAPLKGAHLTRFVYADGDERGFSGDVDVLVRARDFDRAGALLETLGFERVLVKQRPATMREHYEQPFRIAIGDNAYLYLEVHRAFTQPARHPIDYAALWTRSAPADFLGAPCLRLAAEDHILHLVIHLLTDRFGRAKRALRDLEQLFRGGAELSTVVSRSREWLCATATWLTLVALMEFSEGRIPALHARAIEPIRPSLTKRIALRRLLSPSLEFRLAGKGLRREQLALLPFALDTYPQLLRFMSSYAGQRIRDAVESRGV